MGKNDLGALLKKEYSNKFFMDLKDPCHSLNLALIHSLNSIPDELMNFIDGIHNHFVSPQRVSYLHNIQSEREFPMLSPKHYVKTRWLSLGESLQRLLIIWDSLIEYGKETF